MSDVLLQNTDGNRPVNRLSAPEKSRLRAREETGPRAREETHPRAREEACPRAREGKPSKDVRPIRDENTAQGLWDDDDNFVRSLHYSIISHLMNNRLLTRVPICSKSMMRMPVHKKRMMRVLIRSKSVMRERNRSKSMANW